MSDEKAQKPRKGKQQKPAVGNKGKPSRAYKQSHKGTQEKTPAWFVFSRKASAFAVLAKRLAEKLNDLFGPTATISHFERAMAEVANDTSLKSLVAFDQEILDLYERYVHAREERDAERQSFRATKDVTSIAASLETLKGIDWADVPVDQTGPDQ
jgi:hypothetical protein